MRQWGGWQTAARPASVIHNESHSMQTETGAKPRVILTIDTRRAWWPSYPGSEITSGVRARPHLLTAYAQVRGTDVTYPGQAVRVSP